MKTYILYNEIFTLKIIDKCSPLQGSIAFLKANPKVDKMILLIVFIIP